MSQIMSEYSKGDKVRYGTIFATVLDLYDNQVLIISRTADDLLSSLKDLVFANSAKADEFFLSIRNNFKFYSLSDSDRQVLKGKHFALVDELDLTKDSPHTFSYDHEAHRSYNQNVGAHAAIGYSFTTYVQDRRRDRLLKKRHHYLERAKTYRQENTEHGNRLVETICKRIQAVQEELDDLETKEGLRNDADEAEEEYSYGYGI